MLLKSYVHMLLYNLKSINGRQHESAKFRLIQSTSEIIYIFYYFVMCIYFHITSFISAQLSVFLGIQIQCTESFILKLTFPFLLLWSFTLQQHYVHTLLYNLKSINGIQPKSTKLKLTQSTPDKINNFTILVCTYTFILQLAHQHKYQCFLVILIQSTE